ncbi:MAG: hypothetical protein ACQEXX_26865 [Bacillota bacterium]
MDKKIIDSTTITSLISLDDELKKEHDLTLDQFIGIYICKEEGMKYECTPEDAIVFAFTGTGGDHFAFSTMNGLIKDLDTAPILFIQPMIFSNPVKMVANNIRDLFSVFLTLKEFYILERFDWYESESDMLHDIEEHYQKAISSRQKELKFISELIQNQLQITPIKTVFKYISNIREKTT